MDNEKISLNCFEESEILLIMMPVCKITSQGMANLICYFIFSFPFRLSFCPNFFVYFLKILILCYCIYLQVFISLLKNKVGYNQTTKTLSA